MTGEPWRSSLMVPWGSPSPAREEPREPIRGVNVVKLPPTGHDSTKVILLVRGSPFASVRLGQTHCPCLGVKGSQVRILSSRPDGSPLTLAETPRQRAFFMFGVDLTGWHHAQLGTTWGPAIHVSPVCLKSWRPPLRVVVEAARGIELCEHPRTDQRGGLHITGSRQRPQFLDSLNRKDCERHRRYFIRVICQISGYCR